LKNKYIVREISVYRSLSQCSKQFYDLYISTNIIRVIQSRHLLSGAWSTHGGMGDLYARFGGETWLKEITKKTRA
jgi:hypothetical protein